MRGIRKNNEEEKKIVEAKFKVSIIFILSLIFVAVNSILGIISFLFSFSVGVLANDPFIFAMSIVLFPISLFISAVAVGIHLCIIIGIKRSQCIVTNKRIYGIRYMIFYKKRYSYRLDEIDNVETVSSLDIHSLILNFTQGHEAKDHLEKYKIGCLANADELYGKLSALITSIKNEKDLMVDININKIEVESRKAMALEKLAEIQGDSSSVKNSNQTYIEELKGLKDLLDAGIISKSEFEEKKKELLRKA